MAEITLICPGCAAEYRLPSSAIPEKGREVECAACGRVWFASQSEPARVAGAGKGREPAKPVKMSYTVAFGPGATVRREGGRDEAESDPQDPKPLSRRVPESVLNILRDEVEHERRARMAETGGAENMSPATAGRPIAKVAQTEPDWPATTVTVQSDGDASPRSSVPRKRASQSQPPGSEAMQPPRLALPRRSQPDIPEEPQPVAPAGATRALVGAPAPQPDPAAELDLPTAHFPAATTGTPKASTTPGAGGYGTGFGLAAMIAAIGLALYLLAPGMADAGALGDALSLFRESVDQGRIWLQSLIR
jgi:predicted Zn finger-like uncharacterized protein